MAPSNFVAAFSSCKLCRSLVHRSTVIQFRRLHMATKGRQYGVHSRILIRKLPRSALPLTLRRGIIGAASRLVLRQALKLRYWVVGGAIAGGTAVSNKYEDWRQSLPELKWIDESEALSAMRARFAHAAELAGQRKDRIADWWKDDSWLPLAESDGRRSLDDIRDSVGGSLGQNTKRLDEWLELRRRKLDAWRASAFGGSTSEDSGGSQADPESASQSGASTQEENDDDEYANKLREEMLELQTSYEREIERLEKENKNLRQAVMLHSDKTADAKWRKVKRSLIDMYSEVLDLLSDYDSSYSVQDNLPRVVVVGDQSSGKTSVLEMIAQARIFPRGAGEMMTRAPVKVTLSEGPYHVAKFRDSSGESNREYDLKKEGDLAALRREVELRMRRSVARGKTISHDVISLTVKGPSLPRMVLVDLPGVISTVTTDMARETREDIVAMCKQYMNNPNAIILCIQDGSLDAERSNVTDLVSSVDPKGKRTIMVLTKVDLAEQNLTNPNRIKQILDGKLFPMRALGYFAVVTGRGNADDSIEAIHKYEQKFFAQSQLFRDGRLKATQMSTRNMSSAVAKRFWSMVREAVEQQADAFRATRFNLETEWKNNYPKVRELDRNELFDKGRGEILDEMVNLSQRSAEEWEKVIQDTLLQQVTAYVFDNIYLPASTASTAGAFNTSVDIKLKHWADKELPSRAVQVGWQVLRDAFEKQLEKDGAVIKHSAGDDAIFANLKAAVLREAVTAHKWDEKSAEYLRVIQLSALVDREIPDKRHWDRSLQFMETAVRQRLDAVDKSIADMRGPDALRRWVHWTKLNEHHVLRRNIEAQLYKLISNKPDHGPALSDEDLALIRRDLADLGSDGVSNDVIRDSWHHIYRRSFLRRAQRAAWECRSFYYHYKAGFSESDVDCQAVPLFWRVSKMLQNTSNALRQQITNEEQRRLERRIKEVLENWSRDPAMKKKLLIGRRVELAEELKQVRQIQERLEEFIEALNREKPV